MKPKMKRLMLYVLKVIVASAVLGGAAYVISLVTKRNFNDNLVYAGMLCLLVGGLSIVGQRNTSTDVSYFQSRSVGSNSVREITEENYKNRNSSMRFLIFMLLVGAILLGTGIILTEL